MIVSKKHNLNKILDVHPLSISNLQRSLSTSSQQKGTFKISDKSIDNVNLKVTF